MQKVVVLGGGLAGLSSSVFLSRKNIPVLLLEAAPELGGRVSSFNDPSFGAVLDNGQHIMMGCYVSTLEYLGIINALDNFYIQDKLEVPFLKNGEVFLLKASGGVYPFDLLGGLMSFRLLSFKERFELLRFFLLLPLSSSRDTVKLTAGEWLIRNGQGENVRKLFWDVFIIGALNTSAAKASAYILRETLMRVFFSGSRSAAIIIPQKPLTEAFCLPAAGYLKDRNSGISCSERATALIIDRRKNKITGIITSKRKIEGFDYVISALPFHSINKLLPGMVENFRPVYSPILTIHFKTTAELFKSRFIAVTGSPIHWIFRHPSHYTIVISNAGEFISRSVSEIENLIKDELCSRFGIRGNDISALRIVKEKRATFVPSKEVLDERPGATTDYKNLFLAGDWTNTGLPATIEGAIESGKLASWNI